MTDLSLVEQRNRVISEWKGVRLAISISMPFSSSGFGCQLPTTFLAGAPFERSCEIESGTLAAG